MGNQVSLVFPVPQFYLYNIAPPASAYVFNLESYLPPGFVDANTPLKITRLLAWNQGSAQFPAGTHGSIWFILDPQRRYQKASGFGVSATESALPQWTKSLGTWEIRSGEGDKREWQREFIRPYTYRAGDRLLMVVEAVSINGLSPSQHLSMDMFINVSFESDTDIMDWIKGGLVYQAYMQREANYGAGYANRSIIPAIHGGGNQVRVKFGSLMGETHLTNASIGVRSSGVVCTAAPVPLTFSSARNTTITPWSSTWSDWVSLDTSAGNELMVSCGFFSNPNYTWSRRDDGAGAYFVSTDEVDAQSFTSPGFSANTTYCVEQVEVRTVV